MYNLKINVTDLISSKKKIRRMRCGFCVFFGCCDYSLFQTEAIDYDTVNYIEVCLKKEKKDWILKNKKY